MEYIVTFAAGASYGLTTVVVGQPLDTLKVRLQSMENKGGSTVDLFRREGIRGLYRGGLPLFVGKKSTLVTQFSARKKESSLILQIGISFGLSGGSLMRSAQFGVSGKVKHWLDDHPACNQYKFRVFGLVDWQVIVAGVAGGLGRGVLEVPTDFLKTRRQVERSWTWSHLMDGTAITLARNTVLYTAFMVYIDLSKQACRAGYVPKILMTDDHSSLTPFAKGAICANLAWLTVWPADVVKTQRQSGNYDERRSSLSLLQENLRTGRLFRGVVPGLVRSSIANGSSMVVYEWVQTTLTQQLGLQRRDMA